MSTLPTQDQESIPSWKYVFRKGIAPLLSDAHLEALANGLRSNDLRLMQGATTQPPPLMCVQDWPVERACALSYCGWIGDSLETVGEVEEFFARMCFDIDNLLGEPAGCRWFLNWYDETSRDYVFAALLLEVEKEIARRYLI